MAAIPAGSTHTPHLRIPSVAASLPAASSGFQVSSSQPIPSIPFCLSSSICDPHPASAIAHCVLSALAWLAQCQFAGIARKFWNGTPWHILYCFQLLKHGISSNCFSVYSWWLISSLQSCFQVRLGLFQRYHRLFKVYFKNTEGPKSFPVFFLQRQTHQKNVKTFFFLIFYFSWNCTPWVYLDYSRPVMTGLYQNTLTVKVSRKISAIKKCLPVRQVPKEQISEASRRSHEWCCRKRWLWKGSASTCRNGWPGLLSFRFLME